MGTTVAVAGGVLRTLLFVSLLATTNTGCTESVEGRLGWGSFLYECTPDDGPNDIACERDTLFYQDFPNRIAAGGDFSLDVETEDRSAPTVVVRPASLARMTEAPLRMLDEGTHTVVAVDLDGIVYDYIDLSAHAPVALAIEEGPGLLADARRASDGLLFSGEETNLWVYPIDAAQIELAGSFPYTWTSDDPTIATIATDPLSNDVVLEALGPGTATIRVVSGELAAEFQVEVLP